MAKELQSIDITDLPDLVRIAEEVRATGRSRILRREGEDVAVLIPAESAKRRSQRGRVLTEDDPLFRLIGIGKSGIPGGVSGKKHEYLARAYRPR